MRAWPLSADQVESWVSGWGTLIGVGLVAGFLLPVDVEQRVDGNSEAVWPWELMRQSHGSFAFMLLAPLLLGAATFILRASLKGRAQALALFWAGAISLLLAFVETRGIRTIVTSFDLFGVVSDVVTILLLGLLSATAAAVGNRLRRHVPASAIGRGLTIAGSVVLAVCFALPITGTGHSILAALFEPEVWKSVKPFAIFALGVLAYAIIGCFAARRPRDVVAASRWMSVMGRVILVALPFVPVVTVLIESKQSSRAMPLFLVSFKVTTLLYGLFGLVGVGLVGWLTDVFSMRPAPAQPTASAAVVDLKMRLRRLEEAKAAGLMTEEEYVSRRTSILDSL